MKMETHTRMNNTINYNGGVGMVKAIFNQSIVESSNEVRLIELQNYLKQFNRNNCPNEFYHSWKILVLGTNEYYHKQESILNEAIERLSLI
jgi:hypothetical protein